MVSGMETLRGEVVGEEFDYQALLSALRSYAQPRDAITRALASDDIVRVKKGIYVFGPRRRRARSSPTSSTDLRTCRSILRFSTTA
jgi:hypothetical protein